ncbi:MAG: GNAT family N-acetyltransferase [Chitinophaga sp.]|uniref:GNAT family N-acetyltransferase n=1 Tax=Chitinophaga sp. TaxID=1869181 RepID=UPI001B1B60B4|nr:GNAT family N-acetyltransferase [Chitinophaga sp.]MBO9729232.1 GNAT family N-acetyltransferase [Chitinophaga sp.]
MLTFDFNPYTELTTSRFLLRPPLLSDAPEIARLRSDPRVNQYLDRPATTTVEAAQAFLQKILDNLRSGKSLYWVITESNSDKIFGTICLWNLLPELEEAEIGYELQSEFFGKGIMQEVLPAVIRFGFEVIQLSRIIALPLESNERSVKLLERHHFMVDEALRQRLEAAGEPMTGFSCYLLTRS